MLTSIPIKPEIYSSASAYGCYVQMEKKFALSKYETENIYLKKIKNPWEKSRRIEEKLLCNRKQIFLKQKIKKVSM